MLSNQMPLLSLKLARLIKALCVQSVRLSGTDSGGIADTLSSEYCFPTLPITAVPCNFTPTRIKMFASNIAWLFHSHKNLAVLAPFVLFLGYCAFTLAQYHYHLLKIPKLRRHRGFFGAWEDAKEYRDDSAGILRDGYKQVRSLSISRSTC
jgi:hypothetical protein